MGYIYGLWRATLVLQFHYRRISTRRPAWRRAAGRGHDRDEGKERTLASLKGTRTEKNLLTAFAGESQARNRYDYFASQAKKDGFVQISKIFEETALQEKEHA